MTWFLAPFALVFLAGQDDCPMALLAVVHAGTAQAVVFNSAFIVDEEAHFELHLLAHSGHGSPPSELSCFGAVFAVFFPVAHHENKGKVISPCGLVSLRDREFPQKTHLFSRMVVCKSLRMA